MYVYLDLLRTRTGLHEIRCVHWNIHKRERVDWSYEYFFFYEKRNTTIRLSYLHAGLLFSSQVMTLADFFKDESVFIAYGQERLAADDFDLDVNGTSWSKFLFLLFFVIVFMVSYSGHVRVVYSPCQPKTVQTSEQSTTFWPARSLSHTHIHKGMGSENGGAREGEWRKTLWFQKFDMSVHIDQLPWRPSHVTEWPWGHRNPLAAPRLRQEKAAEMVIYQPSPYTYSCSL